MALTQVSTAGVKDDAVTAGKIPADAIGSSEIAANAVGSSELADNAVDTAAIADDAVTAAKLALPLDLADNEKIRLGTGNDLEIYFNGTNSVISHIPNSGDLIFQAPTGETSIRCNASSAVELYHDNVKRFETDSNGARVVAPEGEQAILRLIGDEGDDANDSFRLNAGGGTLKIQDASNQSSWEDNIVINAAGSVELYHDTTKTFQTTANGIELPGSNSLFLGGKIDMPDNDSGSNGKILLGTGDDLEIYHDGSHTWMKNATGRLILQTDGDQLQLRGDSVKFFDGDAGETLLEAKLNGSVDLYYDNTKVFETISNGVKVDSASDAILELHTSNNTAHGRINFSNESGDNYGGVWYSSTNNLELRSNNAERMRITSAGHVLIHASSDSSSSDTGFKVLDWGSSGTWVAHVYNSGTPSNTPGPHLYNLSGSYSGVRFYPRVDGGLANFQSNNANLCDERAKTDIVDLGDQWSTVKQWKVRKFRYKRDPSDTTLKVGVIAQQIETVSPDLVEEDWPYEGEPNNPTTLYKTVKEEQMFMIAMKALQEAMAKIETLETKVAALEAA